MDYILTLVFGFTPAILVLAYLAHARVPRNRTEPADAGSGAAESSPRLQIDGTSSEKQPWLNDSLLKGHAVQLQYVRDIAWYELKHRTKLPDSVAGCLATCYKDGTARGIKIRDLIVFGKGKPGDKLVFALLDVSGSRHIVALMA